MPAADPIVDKCIECGFCEPRCPSRASRSRRASASWSGGRWPGSSGRRETARRRPRLLEAWLRTWGTRPARPMGSAPPPVRWASTPGKLIKALRAEARSPAARRVAVLAGGPLRRRDRLGPRWPWGRPRRPARSWASGASPGSRAGCATASRAACRSGRAACPRARRPAALLAHHRGPGGPALVYFPRCVVRGMGPAPGDPDARAEFEAMLSVLDKAGCEVRFPRDLPALCCGLAFDSKGFPDWRPARRRSWRRRCSRPARRAASRCCARPAPARSRCASGSTRGSRTYEPAELIHDAPAGPPAFRAAGGDGGGPRHLQLDRMGVGDQAPRPGRGLRGTGGRAGRGLLRLRRRPRLQPPRAQRLGARSDLRASLPPSCAAGYSNSRTCEIGLSAHSGIPYQSILYLVDRCSRSK